MKTHDQQHMYRSFMAFDSLGRKNISTGYLEEEARQQAAAVIANHLKKPVWKINILVSAAI